MSDSIGTKNQADIFRKFIESGVLEIIKNLSEKGNVTADRIQSIAQLTLDLIKPEMNLEELYRSAVKLDDQCAELSPLVFKVMKEYEEKHEKTALAEVSHLIKAGQYDQAQDMVKKVLMFKVQN